jgi:regulatory protein
VGFGSPSLKGRALRWLAQREHTRAELRGKLLRAVAAAERASLPAPPGGQATPREPGREALAPPGIDDIDRVLDELTAAGFLSDARAAESLLQLQGRRFGSRRLQQVMRERGVPADLAGPALQQARTTELERAREVWQRRFGQPPADAAERARQMRFLAGRGFDTDVIRRVVGRMAGAAAGCDDD